MVVALVPDEILLIKRATRNAAAMGDLVAGVTDQTDQHCWVSARLAQSQCWLAVSAWHNCLRNPCRGVVGRSTERSMAGPGTADLGGSRGVYRRGVSLIYLVCGGFGTPHSRSAGQWTGATAHLHLEA